MLPIEQILPKLHQQLPIGDAIVVAPPGAGKSTVLPMSLLTGNLAVSRKIVMLQPRRVAARSIAHYLAKQLNEPVGKTVGYRIKGDTQVSASTRLEIVTEGVLTRMLQNDPELSDIGLVIFDEFHERSIHADFSLALCLEVQQALRDDLRLLVMSATLDTQAIQGLMPDALLCHSQGRAYPVDVQYNPDNSPVSLADKVSRLVLEVMPAHQGDCLVFLPGAAEINKAAAILLARLGEEYAVHRLYSSLDKKQQDLALTADQRGRRKVILATNIAETSLTIEGIELVIDSGIEKRAVYDLNKGISCLKRQSISQAAATQRAGRAGRLGPGFCYRLWGAEQQGRMVKQSTPEILHTDISNLVLEAAVWGTAVTDLSLIDRPTAAQCAQSIDYLRSLELLDDGGRITSRGRQVHHLGVSAPVANMLLKAKAMSTAHLSLACVIAALLEHKDPLNLKDDANIVTRLELLARERKHFIWQDIRHWHKKLGCAPTAWPLDDTGLLLAAGFGHWVGRGNGRYYLVNGSTVDLPQDDRLNRSQWLVVASMLSTDGMQGKSKVVYAAALSFEHVQQCFSQKIAWHSVSHWDQDKQAIVARQKQMLGNIVINTRPMAKPADQDAWALWQQIITDKGVMNLPFDARTQQLLNRIRLANVFLPQSTWPDVSEQGLLDNLDNWLLPHMEGVMSWQQMTKLPFDSMITGMLDWQQQTELNQHLPQDLKVPSGSRIKLHYDTSDVVKLSVRMQEVYGLADTPTLARGKLIIQMELLSPAGRALQTTQDLAGFWQGSYKAIQKEMKGRYQKHFWPDDPQTAVATTRTKRKMTANVT